MADFDQILSKSRYSALHDCIDRFPAHRLQAKLAEFQTTNPKTTLSPLLYYCIQQDKQDHFDELLKYGIHPDDDVVQAAARSDNDWFLFRLLQNGWPINQNLRGGTMPSLLCLCIDRPELQHQLLQYGANPNTLSISAETPLSVAVQAGTISSIQSLLEVGADVRLGDPLHYAVERKSDASEVVKLLLSHKTPVNTIQFEHPIARQSRHFLTRGTPLHKACLLSKYDIAEQLLEHDADPNSVRVRNSEIERTTPLDIAKEKRDERMIKLLNSYMASSR